PGKRLELQGRRVDVRNRIVVGGVAGVLPREVGGVVVRRDPDRPAHRAAVDEEAGTAVGGPIGDAHVGGPGRAPVVRVGRVDVDQQVAVVVAEAVPAHVD